MSERQIHHNLLVDVFILTIIVIGLGVFLYYMLYVLKLIPAELSKIGEIIVVGIVGYLTVTLFGRHVHKVSVKLLGSKRGSTLYAVYRFAAYLVLLLALLGLAGVSGTALLAGGAFAGLVLGLAGQTVLGNIMGGITILTARPYVVGERIMLTTAQYGIIVPSYPPKFFSDDYIVPGYTGTVVDIGLIYSTIKLDEGPTLKVPNSVMIQAAVISYDVKERRVRVRYEIPSTIKPSKIIPEIRERLQKNEWVTQPESLRIFVDTTTLNSYVLMVEAICKGDEQEPARSSILLDMMGLVKDFREEH